MSGQPKRHDEAIGYKARRALLLRALPKHAFKVYPAAIEAGYAPSYARKTLPGYLKKDIVLCGQIERMRAENLELAEDKIACADTILRNMIDGTEMTAATKLKALELFYRRHGALADKQIIETAERERELSTVVRAEARKLAKLALAVKEGDIESTIKLMKHKESDQKAEDETYDKERSYTLQ